MTSGFCMFVVFVDQRNLGMSMRIERSSLDQVRKRFEQNKKKLDEKKKEYDFEERIKELKEEVRCYWLMKIIIVIICDFFITTFSGLIVRFGH